MAKMYLLVKLACVCYVQCIFVPESNEQTKLSVTFGRVVRQGLKLGRDLQVALSARREAQQAHAGELTQLTGRLDAVGRERAVADEALAAARARFSLGLDERTAQLQQLLTVRSVFVGIVLLPV